MMLTRFFHWLRERAAARKPTAYATLTRWHATGVLCGFLLFLAVAIWVTVSPYRYQSLAETPPHPSGLSDMDLYWTEARAIHAGEDYYAVAARELTSRGYATQSVFNWRLPLPMWLFGALYEQREIGAGLLAILLAISILVSFQAVRSEGSTTQAVGFLILGLGACLPLLHGDNCILAEAWAAPLLLISAGCLVMHKVLPAIIAGVAAGLFRELAIGYALVMITLAVWKRSWKEVAGWLAGLVTFGLFYGWHIGRVAEHVQSGAVDPAPWLHLGGLGFVLVTVQMNAWIFALPQWVAAVYLSLALLGMGSCDSWNARRVSIATLAYLSLFFVAGYEFNQYWGLLTAPLLCLGVARAPAALWDLRGSLAQPTSRDVEETASGVNDCVRSVPAAKQSCQQPVTTSGSQL